MATTKRSSVVEDVDGAEEAPAPAPRVLSDGPARVLSGWCMTGRHRPTSQTVGCREEFTSFVCPCPCHEESAAGDPRYDSPEPRIIEDPSEED